MAKRARGLLVLALALLVVGGLIVADVATLSKAKPSFDHETQAFQRLLQSTSTTLPPSSSHHLGTSTPHNTNTTNTNSITPVTTSTLSP